MSFIFRTFMCKIANKMVCHVSKSVQLSGGVPRTIHQGLCSMAPLGASPQTPVTSPSTTPGSAPALNHRCRSDWNCGGTHDGTYHKSPAVEAKTTFSYVVMQVIWCLKFCNMTKSGGQSPAPNSGRTCPPPFVIYAHALNTLLPPSHAQPSCGFQSVENWSVARTPACATSQTNRIIDSVATGRC